MPSIKKLISNPAKIINILDRIYISRFLTDEQYIKIRYKANFGKNIDLVNPSTFSEKLQWMKIHYRNDLYTTLVDKIDVKQYVSDKIGEEYIIPTLGIYNKFEDIDFNALPKQFVLKCSHDSGGIFICKNKDNLDLDKARRTINKCLKRNFYQTSREWPYEKVKPRILAEAYMEDKEYGELRDYKFFCFNGNVKALFIASDRQKKCDTKFDFFDTDFNHLNIINGHPNSKEKIKKPVTFDKMLSLASILSKGIPQVRVDLYEVNGEIYFGEYTFFHHGGFTPFEPEEWDKKFGSWFILPEANK